MMENPSGAFDEEQYTEEEFEKEKAYWLGEYDKGNLDEEYASYLMDNCHGEGLPIICNGDTLISAMESQVMLDEFLGSRK